MRAYVDIKKRAGSVRITRAGAIEDAVHALVPSNPSQGQRPTYWWDEAKERPQAWVIEGEGSVMQALRASRRLRDVLDRASVGLPTKAILVEDTGLYWRVSVDLSQDEQRATGGAIPGE